MINGRARKAAVCIFFLSLFLGVALAVLPICRALSKAASFCAESARSALEEKTGLRFSYKSMSPSIFSLFSMKGITLSSAKTGRVAVSARRVTLRYSILKILRGYFDNAFGDLSINGVTVNIDERDDADLLERLAPLAPGAEGAAAKGAGAVDVARKVDAIAAKLPFRTTVKNVSVNFNGRDVGASCVFRKISLSYDSKDSSLGVDAAGGADVWMARSPSKKASAQISIDGVARPGLEGSSAVARLFDLHAGDIAVDRVNFLVTFKDSLVSARTTQTPLPLMARADYDMAAREARAEFHTKNLALSSFYSPRSQSAALKKILSSSVTLDMSARRSFGENILAYESSGKAELPRDSGGGEISYALSGDGRSLRLKRLDARSPALDMDAELSLDFERLNVSGFIGARKVSLPGGVEAGAEFLFDPLDRGFVCMAPQISIGSVSLNAMELSVIPRGDSVDFGFEVSDYSHSEDADEPGRITLDGSYLSKTRYVQAALTAQRFFVDTALKLSSMFIKESARKKFSPFIPLFKPYMLAGEMYLSSDMKSLSYNMPYALVANTMRDNQFIYASLDGNESSLQISQLDMISGKSDAHISAQLDRSPDKTGAFFTVDMTAGTIPYRFTGNVMQNFLTVTDDYGSSLQAAKKDGGFEGSLAMTNFPFKIADYNFALSSEIGFASDEADGLAVHVSRMEAEGSGGRLAIAPRFALAGDITKYGAFFDTLSYSDSFSTLAGSAQGFWNANDGLFDSARLEVSLENPMSPEKISARGEIANPGNMPLSLEMLTNNLYYNAEVSCSSLGLSRFVTEQSDNNLLSARATASGTFSAPYVSLSVEQASVMFAGIPVTASGSASIVEKEVGVEDFHVKYGEMNLSGITARYSLADFTGEASALFDVGLDEKLFSVPLKLSMSGTTLSERTRRPESFTLMLSSEGATGTILKSTAPFSFTVMRSASDTAIFSSDNIGISGYLVDGGDANIYSDIEGPFGFRLSGKNDIMNLDFKVSDLHIDLAKIISMFDNNSFAMYNGLLTGSVTVKGIRSDPDFTGALAILKPDFSILQAIPYHITADKILLTAMRSQITIHETLLTEKGADIYARGKIYFDRWMFDYLEIFVRTPPKKTAPVLLDVGVAKIKGDVSTNLTVMIDRNKILDISGDILAEDANATVRVTDVARLDKVMPHIIFDTRLDLDITIGQHVRAAFDPFLRAVLVPYDKVNFQLDETQGAFSLTGDVKVKSGDVSWFNRSFYLKECAIKLNCDEDMFDPIISLRAETRERDDDGRDVKIIMSAQNQLFSTFSPTFTSVPAKSENEILEMLGQIAVGDAGGAGDLVLAAGDYALQSTIGRVLENKLRDLLKFDILSVRTNVVQNALKLGISGNSSSSKITAGNFLDNSTVYIGKYIGSVIYIDGMLHLSYDERRADDSSTVNGISFQPEIGFELEAPFAGIRWSMTPNIDSMLNDMFDFRTSVTLSWRFAW